MKHSLRCNLTCLLSMISTLTKMGKILATIIQKQVNLILIYVTSVGVPFFFLGLPLKNRLWLPMIFLPVPAPWSRFKKVLRHRLPPNRFTGSGSPYTSFYRIWLSQKRTSSPAPTPQLGY